MVSMAATGAGMAATATSTARCRCTGRPTRRSWRRPRRPSTRCFTPPRRRPHWASRRCNASGIAATHGWSVPLERPTTTDFASFYAAGALANAGTPELAYDQAAHFAMEQAVTEPGIEYQFFNYPPVYLILCAALAHQPYLPAFVLFIAATLFFYLAVARRILDDHSGTALLVLLAFSMAFWNIGLGQNAFLTAGLFGMATLLIDSRPVVAGLLFGLLCYKPHFGLLIPVALAAGGHWRSFAAAAASAGLLVLASLVLYGW